MSKGKVGENFNTAPYFSFYSLSLDQVKQVKVDITFMNYFALLFIFFAV